jgi:hypothetical protein
MGFEATYTEGMNALLGITIVKTGPTSTGSRENYSESFFFFSRQRIMAPEERSQNQESVYGADQE